MKYKDNFIFEDRADAGIRLANVLEEKKYTDPVILAIPRGGIPVALPIAKKLEAPLDLIIPRKIGHPYNPEYAIGAINELGEFISTSPEYKYVNEDWLNNEIEIELKEIKRRNKLYSQNKKISLQNKTIIIVDDGIATGATVLASIAQIRKINVKEIIVAVPVCTIESAKLIKKNADALVSLIIPIFFKNSISDYYKNFPQVSDEEVIKIIGFE